MIRERKGLFLYMFRYIFLVFSCFVAISTSLLLLHCSLYTVTYKYKWAYNHMEGPNIYTFLHSKSKMHSLLKL